MSLDAVSRLKPAQRSETLEEIFDREASQPLDRASIFHDSSS